MQSSQRRLSDLRRLEAVPTQRSLTRLLRGAPPADDAVDGRRPAPTAGIVLPNSAISNYVPNDLVDMIVTRVGPRDVPADLRREVEKYLLFLQGKSLKYRNESTLERVDFNPMRLQWWRDFFFKLHNISIRNLMLVSVELRVQEVRLHSPRGADVDINEWLAVQDSANDVEYDDSVQGTAKAFGYGMSELLLECQKPDVNCLQIDMMIGNGDEAFGDKLKCLRHDTVLKILDALPFGSMSTASQFSAVFRHKEQHWCSIVSLLFYSPAFVAQCAKPREPLFDATAWMRVFMDEHSEYLSRNFGQTLAHEPISVGQGELFPSRSRASSSVKSGEFEARSRRASRAAWMYLIRSLLEIQQLYQTEFNIIKLNLDPESHEPRSRQTQGNLLSSLRDSDLHLSLDEHDFSGSQLVENGQINLVESVEASLKPEAQWNAIHLKLNSHHQQSTYTAEELVRLPGMLRFFSRFESLLKLPNEQVSLVIRPLTEGWSYITLLLYSPNFVLECAQTAKNRAERLGTTRELKQAALLRSSAHSGQRPLDDQFAESSANKRTRH